MMEISTKIPVTQAAQGMTELTTYCEDLGLTKSTIADKTAAAMNMLKP